MELNTEDLSILTQQDNETLAKWYCILNSWEWPKALPNPEPPHHKTGDRRGQLMSWIHAHVGQKIISRTWNHDMTDEEFEEWWSHTFGDMKMKAAEKQRWHKDFYERKKARLEKIKPMDAASHRNPWADLILKEEE